MKYKVQKLKGEEKYRVVRWESNFDSTMINHGRWIKACDIIWANPKGAQRWIDDLVDKNKEIWEDYE